MNAKNFIATLLLLVAGLQTTKSQNTINGHEYVDLRLPSGTLWATMNVGASSPTEEGTMYDNTSISSFGWNGSWTLPTEEQWNELVSNCTITHNGTAAMAEYSKISFTFTSNNNSNSIVMPGYIWDDTYDNVRHYIMYSFILSENKDAYYYTTSTGVVFSGTGAYQNTYNIRPVAVSHLFSPSISSVPDGWTVKAGATASDAQAVTITNGITDGISPGNVVIVKPANIPAGKKIKSIKVLPVE